jgi:hypothetical protein
MGNLMYQLNVSATIDRNKWNQSLNSLNANPFHTYEWSIYSSENSGYSPIYFTQSDSIGGLSAVSHGVVKSHISSKVTPFRTLRFGSLPAFTDSDALNKLVQKIHSYAAAKGFMLVDWNSFGSPAASMLCNVWPNDRKKRWEFLVELGNNEEQLWKYLHGKKRNMIKKAMKSGLHVQRVQNEDKVICYRDLAMKTWKRKQEQGIPFPVPPGRECFERIKRLLIDPGIGRMYLAYDGIEPIAGAFFVSYVGVVYYVMSAADQIGLKKSAPDLIIWTAMVDYMTEGCRSFNLGGVSEDELHGKPLERSGLYNFKVRFSAKVHPCFKASVIVNPFRHRIYRMLKRIKTSILR